MDYTYGGVVGTLAAVEASNPDVYVRIDNPPEDDPTKPFNPNEPEHAALSTPPKPVTRGLRSTVKHLRARAGFWSRFRGLSMYLCYILTRTFVSGLVPVRTQSFIGQFLVQSLLSLALATWQMAWVHIIISEPSPKRFYQRIPSFRTWIKIAPAAALEDILIAAAFFFPIALASFAGWLDSKSDDPLNTVGRMLAGMGISTLVAFLLSIPARVIFIRVAASMLPEEDETIVPFDRSFGGKVQPQIVGGSGHVGLRDAWTTFDWAARVRFAKVIGKTLLIEFALILLAGVLVFAQVLSMAPDALRKGDGSAKPSAA